MVSKMAGAKRLAAVDKNDNDHLDLRTFIDGDNT